MKYSNGISGGAFRVTADNGAWREYRADGSIVRENPSIPGFMCPVFPADYDLASDSVKLQPAPHCNVYIRFGEMPSGGKSRNWADGKDEAGISAYEACWDIVNQCYVPYGALPGAEIAYRIKGANVYLISGNVNGRGSDGEPTLESVTVVAQLRPTQHGYAI